MMVGEKMMTREEFYALAEEVAKNVVGGDGYEICLQDVTKMNKSYKGLLIREVGKNISVAVDLDDAYEKMDGDPTRYVRNMVKSILRDEIPDFKTDVFDSYEKAKERLFVRLSNEKSVKMDLEEIPHMKICDLVLTYHVKIDGVPGKDTIAFTTVNKALLEKWMVEPRTMHNDALKNSAEIEPETICSLFKMMQDFSFGEDDDYEEEEEEVNGPIVVTNKSKHEGASALFYPGVAEKLQEMIGGDFYILPSSIHEVLVMKAEGCDPEELKAMVCGINATEVAPEERLSNHVYKYDGTFSIAA